MRAFALRWTGHESSGSAAGGLGVAMGAGASGVGDGAAGELDGVGNGVVSDGAGNGAGAPLAVPPAVSGACPDDGSVPAGDACPVAASSGPCAEAPAPMNSACNAAQSRAMRRMRRI